MRALRTLLPVALIGVIGLGAITTAPSTTASAAAGGKVTICHRTHSTTNPYRRITVSISAVNGSSANDHTHHTGAVFDPNVTYPANAKNWGDIIPDSANGGSGNGLNWATGSATYNSTRCGAMTAQQFYDTEYAAGVPVADILADLDDQQADEDAALVRQIGSFSSPTGASTSFAASTTTTVVSTVASTTLVTTTTAAPTTTAPTTTTPTTTPPATTTPAVSTVAPGTDPSTTAAPSTVPDTTVADTSTTTTTGVPDTTSTTSTTTTSTTTTTTVTPTTVSPSTDPSTTTPGTTPGADPSTTSSTTSTTVATTDPPATAAPTTTTVTVVPSATGARVIGVAWFDANRNGRMDGAERPLPGVPVQLQAETTRVNARSTNVVRSGVTVTRSDGSFEFTRVAPGDYLVVGNLDAAGIGRIWDTDGAADWHVRIIVPAGGVGRADMAAVGDGVLRGVVRLSTDESPVPGAEARCTWAGLDGSFDTGDDAEFPTIAGTDGRFQLDGVPYGPFRCGATDPRTGTPSDTADTVVDAGGGDVILHVPSDAVSPDGGGTLPRTGADQWPLLMWGLLFIIGGIACGVGARQY